MNSNLNQGANSPEKTENNINGNYNQQQQKSRSEKQYENGSRSPSPLLSQSKKQLNNRSTISDIINFQNTKRMKMDNNNTNDETFVSNDKINLNGNGNSNKTTTRSRNNSRCPSVSKEISNSELEIKIEEEIKPEEIKSNFKLFKISVDHAKAFFTIPVKDIFINQKEEAEFISQKFTNNGRYEWVLKVTFNKKNGDIDKTWCYLEATPNQEEKQKEDWKRDEKIFLKLVQKHGDFTFEKQMTKTFTRLHSDWGISKSERIDANINDYFIFECHIRDNKSNKDFKGENDGYVGLVNAGNTCYMNSFLQTLYHLSAFSRIVFSAEYKNSGTNNTNDISSSLQRLFYNLKNSAKAVGTSDLTKSFGWDSKQTYIQQDVQEFCCLLLDALEAKFENNGYPSGNIVKLFQGKMLNYIQCMNVDYKSTREETLIELQLSVKGMKDIYDSLDSYIQEEILDGNNMYQTESHGKQIAKKGIRFISLPPVLMIQLKRFEYDYIQDKNIKINEHYKYYEKIDIQNYLVDKKSQETVYNLFSVLVHSGTGATSGHYYAYIRPTKGGKWYKFNDETVTIARSEDALEDNFGGTYLDARLNREKEIEPREEYNHNSAYMLVYIREDMENEILRPLTEEDIPKKLRDEIEKNKKDEESRKKKNEEFCRVFLTTWDILKGANTPGLAFSKLAHSDDNEDYRTRFLNDKNKRIKLRLKKTIKVNEFIDYLQEKTNLPKEEIILWKISQNNEKITLITKEQYSKGSQNLNILVNGVNNVSMSFKSLIFMHPINKYKYQTLLGIQDQNLISNDEYENDRRNNLWFRDCSSIEDDNIMQIEEPLPSYKSILEEEYLLVFVKIYDHKDDDEPRIKMFDYMLINKQATLETLIERLTKSYPKEYKWDTRIYYREEKKKNPLTPLELGQPIDDGDSYGVIVVIDFTMDNSIKENAQQYYEKLSRMTWITFINSKEPEIKTRELLDNSMTYEELVNYISREIFESTVAPEYIQLKAKIKLFLQSISYAQSLGLKLFDMIRNDDKIYYEISGIRIAELEKKIKCMVSYYSNIFNIASEDKEIFIDKEAKISDLSLLINNETYFQNQIAIDRESSDEIKLTVGLFIIDKQKEKLLAKCSPEMPIDKCIKQGKIRAELIPENINELIADPLNPSFFAYCFHATKDSDVFSHPFWVLVKRNMTNKMIRQTLYEKLIRWDIEAYDKKIKINEEYFSKIKMIIKGEITDKIVRIENDETNPFVELESASRKYTLEIIHPFTSPGSNSVMRINK